MNRVQRRGNTLPRRNDSFNTKFKPGAKVKGNGIKVLFSPPIIPSTEKKSVAHRCCYVSPTREDFGQHYTGVSPNISKNSGQFKLRDSNLINTPVKDQFGYEPIDRISPITTVKASTDTCKKDRTSLQQSFQASDKPSKYTAVFDGTHWQQVNSSEEVDKFLSGSNVSGIRSSKHILISKVPRVKVIAEKYSTYKRGNLELRRLDEKVVCVEYDVFYQSSNDNVMPVQKMRAFFSIKPSVDNNNEEQGPPRLPEHIKNEFNILDDDLQKLTEKEIEFIDDKIEENKSYFEDLRRILKRKKVVKAQMNKTSLDLQHLYEMAKRERPPMNDDLSGANFMSKAELQEIKDLILQRCTSSKHGFRRRTLKQKDQVLSPDIGVISESMMTELLAITKNVYV